MEMWVHRCHKVGVVSIEKSERRMGEEKNLNNPEAAAQVEDPSANLSVYLLCFVLFNVYAS